MTTAPTMTLEVLLFASLKEKAGTAALPLTLPAGTTVGELAAHVREAAPAIAPYLAATRVAVNMAFAPVETVIAPGDQVALIPPVGGG